MGLERNHCLANVGQDTGFLRSVKTWDNCCHSHLTSPTHHEHWDYSPWRSFSAPTRSDLSCDPSLHPKMPSEKKAIERGSALEQLRVLSSRPTRTLWHKKTLRTAKKKTCVFTENVERNVCTTFVLLSLFHRDNPGYAGIPVHPNPLMQLRYQVVSQFHRGEWDALHWLNHVLNGERVGLASWLDGDVQVP